MSPPAPWRLMRLWLVFLLDIVEVARRDGEGVDPLILSAVASASVAPITQDAELERAYATMEAPPPDELRRPISINAVASSLGLPYETVRRRLRHLANTGRVRITPRGVVQPRAAVEEPRYLADALARYERLRRLYADLLAIGALPPELRSGTGPELDGPPVRLANRVIGDWALRAMERLMALAGNPLDGLALLEVARSSGEHLDALVFPEDRPLSEALRRPVRASAVAARLNMPQETIRRRLANLSQRGALRRTSGGYVIADAVGGEAGLATASAAADDLRRMFDRLGALGVLAWWDSEWQTGARRRTEAAGQGRAV